MKHKLGLIVNGERCEVMVDPHRTLLQVLRDHLGLFGTKKGCDEGTCGACTVLVDGRPRTACLTLALNVDESEVLTIEGLAESGKLHPLQIAFAEQGAVQCGFCTPGMILASKALLDRNPDPSRQEIEEGLAGNFCRCTGYTKIIEAVRAAATSMAVSSESQMELGRMP